ncbi:MAG: NAD(P)-dependent oxidoreductase [Bacteroidales bacterium]|nr:NAD(P)-dependent oxidoreductase [Bacteroidales bacterium]
MWIDIPIYKEDMDYILNVPFIQWSDFKNTNILITGGTGHIGSNIINALLYVDLKLNLNINIYAVVRNLDKAQRMFQKQLDVSSSLHFYEGSVQHPISISKPIDYVIHCASPTASHEINSQPLQVIYSGVIGMVNLIEMVKNTGCKGFVYLSSMEAYGEITSEHSLKEHMLGYLDLQNVRNSYPETKRMCEMLVKSAFAEYNLPAKSIRLAQTFGPGIAKNDSRVFAMMARCVINGDNIILKTSGTSKHPYLYTSQAVTAIISVLRYGENGKVYNAANPNTYCSIQEMAQFVCSEIAHSNISVEFDLNSDISIYPKPSFLNMDVSALCSLGWTYSGTLKDMYERMISCMQYDN